LEKLFTHKDDGTLWRNALYSIWLSYTTSAIVRIDQAVIQNADKKKRDIETKFTEENFHDNENKDSDYSNDFERIEKMRYNENKFNINTGRNTSYPFIDTDKNLDVDLNEVNIDVKK
jgi:hypothetical protein